jgi:hypothetical protein
MKAKTSTVHSSLAENYFRKAGEYRDSMNQALADHRPNAAALGTSGSIDATGYNLLNPTTCTATPGITGTGINLDFTNGDCEYGETANLSYTIDGSTSTGPQTLTLSNGYGTSNGVTFTVDDPAPVINQISPSTWPAGVSNYQVTITGSGFGISPTVTTNDPHVTFFSPPSVGNGLLNNGQLNPSQQITIYVNVDPYDPGGPWTLTVTSNGFGNGLLEAPPGGSLNAQGGVHDQRGKRSVPFLQFLPPLKEKVPDTFLLRTSCARPGSTPRRFTPHRMGGSPLPSRGGAGSAEPWLEKRSGLAAKLRKGDRPLPGEEVGCGQPSAVKPRTA